MNRAFEKIFFEIESSLEKVEQANAVRWRFQLISHGAWSYAVNMICSLYYHLAEISAP